MRRWTTCCRSPTTTCWIASPGASSITQRPSGSCFVIRPALPPAGRSPAPRIESNLVSAARHVGHEVAGQHPGERRSRQSLGVAQGALENVRKGALQRLRLHLEGIWVFHAFNLAREQNVIKGK